MDVSDIINIIQGFLYGLNLFITLLYSCLILFVRRFRHHNNIFILNICISITISWIYFIIYFLVAENEYPREICNILYYAFNIASIETPFAFVAFSINRFCSLVYHTKPFFTRQRWVGLCIAIQWISQFIISLPFFARTKRYCANQLSLTIYTFIIAAVLPSVINAILNILIFFHVRSSTHRVHPQTISALTSGINNQHTRITRRDISLLRQMIFMFTMFIGGWTPVFIVNILSQSILLDFKIVQITVIFSQLCVLGIVINLFIYNHAMKQYLYDKIRACFHR